MQPEYRSEHDRGMAALRAYTCEVGGKQRHFISLLEKTLDGEITLSAGAIAQRNATSHRLRHCLNDLVNTNLRFINPSLTPSQEQLDDAVENFLDCVKEIRELAPYANLPNMVTMRLHTKNMVDGMEGYLQKGEEMPQAKMGRMRIATERELAKNGNWLKEMLAAHGSKTEPSTKPHRAILSLPSPTSQPIRAISREEEADKVQTAIGMVTDPASGGPWYVAFQKAFGRRLQEMRKHFSVEEYNPLFDAMERDTRHVETRLMMYSDVVQHNFHHPDQDIDETPYFAALANAVAALREYLPDDADKLPNREQFGALQEAMQTAAREALAPQQNKGGTTFRDYRKGGGPDERDIRR